MNTTVRLAAFVCAMAAGACDTASRPTAPSSAPSARYQFIGPLSYAVSGYTAESSYELNRGQFTFRYGSLGTSYVGTYQQEGSHVDFRFAVDGRWDAVGTLNGDSLEVRYNEIMGLTDFEDAVYRRIQ